MDKKILIIGEGSGGGNHLKSLKLIEKKLIIKSVSSRKFIKSFRKNNKNYIDYDPNYIHYLLPIIFSL